MPIAGAEVWPKKSRLFFLAALVLALCSPVLAQAPATSSSYYDPLPQDTGASGLKLELRKLQTTGRLMMVVAHPDDEDGGLLTREARGKGVQTLLMTLTRGEGGQNKTGGTFSDELGVLRTLELLASDRYYGVEQRFSRVADFGYSKTADETFQKWGGHDIPLQDIVRVIREFRPDVLIARFSGTDRDGHGHHQASSILTQEAFRAAADPKRFPEQIKEGLQPWQAKKLYIGNVCGFGASTCADENYTVRINTGEFDPVLGMSYAQFAIEGLRHQKSQGLADINIPSGPRYAFYKLADSTVLNTKDTKGHEQDLFDGIDTSVAAIASRLGDEERKMPWVRSELKQVTAKIGDSPEALAKMVDDLHSISHRLDRFNLAQSAQQQVFELLSTKQEQADAALSLALGLNLEVTVAAPQEPVPAIPPEKEALTEVSPGQRFEIVAKLHNGSKEFLNVAGAHLEPPSGWLRKVHAESATMKPDEDYYANFLVQVPADAPLTHPYWHRDHPQSDSVYQVDSKYQSLALPPPPLNVRIDYEIAPKGRFHSLAAETLMGHRLSKSAHQQRAGIISSSVMVPFEAKDVKRGMLPLAITPAYSVELEPDQQTLPLSNGAPTRVAVRVTSNLSGAPAGELHLDLPTDWRADPQDFDVTLAHRGETKDYSFKVLPANLAEGRAQIRAILDVGGKKYSQGYTLVTREDLGAFYYFHPAVQRISIVDVKLPKDLKVGYIMGAGDDIPDVLRQLGMNVTSIPADKIASENLEQYGTIVLGVRAYDTHKELAANNKTLLDFVSSGGTLIVQNNNSVGDFNGDHLTPYPAELSRARVSVEEAPVTILAPENPIFHYPNEISQKDFDGWVQERGLYFMDSWDDQFKPLLSSHDPGEQDQKGGLLIARYGKGVYIYTGYAFFRQLPAGAPGAIRLFVNLVSAGHQQ
jgi:LmbE family N-acetylglucosaminyl deacetylase